MILEAVLQSGENDVPDSVLFTVLPIFVLVVGRCSDNTESNEFSGSSIEWTFSRVNMVNR